jgi:hypothetical protein
MRHALIAIFLAGSLTGCGDAAKMLNLSLENERLKTENADLREQIKEATTAINFDFAQRKADLEHWQREATIAAACDYIIPICPESMTIAGRTAIAKEEYSGGGTLFWVLVGAKFSTFAFALAAFFLTIRYGALIWIEPEHERIEQAKATIKEAEGKAKATNARAREAELRLEQIWEDIERAEKERAEADEAAQKARRAVETEREALETIQLAKNALIGL